MGPQCSRIDCSPNSCGSCTDSHDVGGSERLHKEGVLLTELDSRLVEKSWAKIMETHGVEAFGVSLLTKLCDLSPALLHLFPSRGEVISHGWDKSPKLKSHGVKIVKTFNVAICSIRDLDSFVPVLRSLAMRHDAYGVRAEAIPLFREAFIRTLRVGLAAEFTHQSEAAWESFWRFILQCFVTHSCLSSEPMVLVEASPVFKSEKKRAHNDGNNGLETKTSGLAKLSTCDRASQEFAKDKENAIKSKVGSKAGVAGREGEKRKPDRKKNTKRSE